MDHARLLLYYLDFVINLPAAFLCILPVLDHSKISKRLTVIIASAVTAITAIPLALICSATKTDPNIPLFILLIPLFAAYMLLFDVKKTKLWYLFISAIAVFSFGGLATHFTKAMLDDPNEELISLAIKWCVSLLFMLAEAVFLKKLRWLFDNENINGVWKFVWVVPLIVAAANFMMIPEDYNNVHVGHIFELYVLSEVLLITFFVIFLVMQYSIARAVTNKAEAEQNAHILGLQAAQYENLKTIYGQLRAAAARFHLYGENRAETRG